MVADVGKQGWFWCMRSFENSTGSCWKRFIVDAGRVVREAAQRGVQATKFILESIMEGVPAPSDGSRLMVTLVDMNTSRPEPTCQGLSGSKIDCLNRRRLKPELLVVASCRSKVQ